MEAKEQENFKKEWVLHCSNAQKDQAEKDLNVLL